MKITARLRSIINYGPKLVFSVPSRIFFGNSNQLIKHNVLPKIHSLRFIRNHIPNQNSKILEANGFLILPSVGLEETWNNLQTVFAEKINDPETSEKFREYSFRITNLGELESLVKKILNTSEVREVLEGYFGVNSYYVKQIDATRNLTFPGNKYIYSNFWHFDRDKLTSIRLYLNLQDTNSETGATRVIGIKRTKQLVRTFKFTHTSLPSGRKLSDPEIEYAGGRLGSVVFFNPQRILHAATIPTKSAQRDSIALHIDFKR